MKNNKILAMLNIDKIKQMIANCPPDEVVIICGHWSINKPKYDNAEDEDWDMDEIEQILDGHILEVSQYDDLIINVHGLE